MQEEENTAILYYFYIDAWVKNFKGQRIQTSIHLAPEFRMQCTNVDDFKIKLWNQFSCHVKGIATIPVNLQEPCSVQEDSNNIDNIASYFIFQKNNRSIFIRIIFHIDEIDRLIFQCFIIFL